MTSILKISRNHPEIELLEQARRVLCGGGLVILPTETVYGIACDPAVPGALQKLVDAKGRDGDKPIARLAADARQAQAEAADWHAGLEALAAAYWPGPLTIVLATAGGWTGYRVPDHAVALGLVARCGHPLALTSANRSGQPDTTTAAAAAAAVAADLALDSGPSAGSAIPSTVVKVDGKTLFCLREGCLPFEDVKRIFSRGAP